MNGVFEVYSWYMLKFIGQLKVIFGLLVRLKRWSLAGGMFVCYIRTCMCTRELMIQVLEVVSLGPLYAVTEAMYINVCSIRIHNSQLCMHVDMLQYKDKEK